MKDVLTDKFEIKFIEKKDCESSITKLSYHGSYEYFISYNPDLPEKKQLLCILSAFMQIVSREIIDIFPKAVYTGRFSVLDEVGKIIADPEICLELFTHIETLSDDIMQAQTISDILRIFEEHSIGIPGRTSFFSLVYDFDRETMLCLRTEKNDIYYVKVVKN